MVLDTNILIAYLGNDKKVVEAINNWFAHNLALFISVVSYVEVLSLPEATASDLERIRQFLANFILVGIDRDLGEMVAELKRHTKFKFPDAAVAATALSLVVSLVTRDKQLKRAKAISIIEL